MTTKHWQSKIFVLVLYLLTNKYLSSIPVDRIHMAERLFLQYIDMNCPDITGEIRETGALTADLEDRLKAAYEAFRTMQQSFMRFVRENYNDIPEEIREKKQISPELEERLNAARDEFQRISNPEGGEIA